MHGQNNVKGMTD